MATKQKTVQKESNAQPAKSGNRPIIKVSVAGMIFGVVWANEVQREDGSSFTAYTSDIYRRYRDSNGEYQTSHTFRTSDLPKVAMVATQLWEQQVLLGVEVTAQAEFTE